MASEPLPSVSHNEQVLKSRSLALGPGVHVGNLILTDRVHHGPFGEEWLALDAEHGSSLLVILPEFRKATDRALVGRLMRELHVAQQLSHPSVLRASRHEIVDGRRVVVCDQPKGESLEAYLRRETRMPVMEVLSVARYVAATLVHAERHNVVHRWIRPSVLYRDCHDFVEVGGYGLWPLANWHGEVSATQGAQQGQRYAAPEVLAGETVDGRADVYSLGVTMLHLLTGFGSASHTQQDGVSRIAALKQLDVGSPALDGIQEELQALLSRVCALDPAGRPPPSELLSQLDALHATFMAEAPTFRAEVQAGRSQRPMEARHSLPLLPAPLIGRSQELSSMRELIASRQLVSLVGPGGVGKTSLAVAIGRSLVDEVPGGVWFCDLASSRSQAEVVNSVGRGMGLALVPQSVDVQVRQAIVGRGRALYVLDNCEQAIDVVATLVGQWASENPEAQFLLTSREPVRAVGEVAISLGPLSVPTHASVSTANPRRRRAESAYSSLHIPTEVASSPSVQLFLDRASAVRRGFSLNATNWQAIGGIVRRLDGIPLAVRLAAALVTSLSPAQILERLAGGAIELSGSGELAGTRHASLHAAIRWSWDMLRPWEQAALAQLSVFRGGFTVEAAEAVVDVSAWANAPWVMDIVHVLWVKSLLTCEADQEGEVRFGMLETIHEFAEQMLGESVGELKAAATRRHWEFFASRGHPAIFAHTPVGQERVRRNRDGANVAVAFHRAREARATPEAAWLGNAAIDHVVYSGEGATADDLVESVQVIPADCPETLTWREYLFAETLGRTHGPETHLAHAEQAMLASKNCGDSIYQAMAHVSMMWGYMYQSRQSEMISHGEEAIRLASGRSETRGMRIHILLTMSFAYSTAGNAEKSGQAIAAAEAMMDPKGDELYLMWILDAQVFHHLYQWRVRDAIKAQHAHIAVARSLKRFGTEAEFQIGMLLRVAGEVEEARVALRESMEQSRRQGALMRANLIESHLRLAEFQDSGFSEAAERRLVEGLERFSAGTTRYFTGGGPLFATAAWSAASRGDLVAAKEYLVQAEAAERMGGADLPPVRQADAFIAMKEGRYEDARRSLVRGRGVAGTDPDDSIPLITLGHQLEIEAARAGAARRPSEAIEEAVAELRRLEAVVEREQLTPKSIMVWAIQQLRECLQTTGPLRYLQE